MFRRTNVLVFALLLTCCNQNEKPGNEKNNEVQIGVLKIDIPSSAKFLRGKGVDSYVAYIVSSRNDTFDIEYGQPNIIYDLFDYPPKALPLKDKAGIEQRLGKLPSPDEAVFSKLPEKDNIQNIYQKEFYMYDTVNGIIAKVVQPKKTGQGKTGLYIPELKDGNSFSIYAKNLDTSAHQKALQMFKTIRYK